MPRLSPVSSACSSTSEDRPNALFSISAALVERRACRFRFAAESVADFFFAGIDDPHLSQKRHTEANMLVKFSMNCNGVRLLKDRGGIREFLLRRVATAERPCCPNVSGQADSPPKLGGVAAPSK